MAELKRTTKGIQKHYHIAYLRDDGTGITSSSIGKGEKHTHEIIMGQQSPIQNLNATPMIINHDQLQNDFLPAGWNVMMTNGHTHELEDYIKKEISLQETDKEIVNQNLILYEEAKNIERESRKKAEESEAFYKGDQWPEGKIRELNSQNRAAVTINEIESKIKLLSGYQRQNRFDFRFLPVEDGDSRVADILNIVVKNICDQNNFEFEESDVFLHTAITGRGLLNHYIDYDKNIEGDIRIECFPWKDVVFGKHNKVDLSDCEYLIKTKWFSKAKVEELWPDKADEIAEEFQINNITKVDHDSVPGGKYTDSDNISEIGVNTSSMEYINIKKKEIKVLECWRKKYKQVFILVNTDDDFYFNADGWSKEDVDAIKSIDGFSLIPRIKTMIRIVTSSGKVLLSDDYPELAEQDFHIIPVYADKIADDFWGKIEALKDPQRVSNKFTSQTIDIINKCAAYGFYIDSETFPDEKEEAKFKKTCASPGFVAKVSNTDRPPKEVEGVKFPSEIVNLAALASGKMREISSINLELEGLRGRADSGVAEMQRKQQALIGNEFLFDNMRRAKKKSGRLLIKMIQKIYSPERIMRIVDNQNHQSPVDIGGQQLYPEGVDPQQRRQEILQILENADLTKYDVAISDSAFSPTMKRANFIIWSEMARNGIPVPPTMLVDLSDLPEKDKVKAQIIQMLQMQAQQEQQKMNTEITKSQIAAQSRQNNTNQQGTP